MENEDVVCSNSTVIYRQREREGAEGKVTASIKYTSSSIAIDKRSLDGRDKQQIKDTAADGITRR